MKKIRQIASALLGVGLLGLAASLCGCGSEEPELQELRIGLLMDVNPVYGNPELRGAELAAALFNESGGLAIDGRRYAARLIVADTVDRPEEAARETLKLINQDRVMAIVASSRSANVLPAATVAEAAQIPLISPGATHPEVTAGKAYCFRAMFVDPVQAEALARFARQDLKAQEVAVLYDVANAYSRGIAEVFREVFEAAGGEIVAFETYTTGDSDFSVPIERIRDRDPQVLFLPNYYYDVLLQTEQARQLELQATFLGSDGWVPARILGNPQVEGAYLVANWDLKVAHAYAGGEAFVEAFRQEYGEDPTFGLAALTYDALGLLLTAVRRAGSTVPEEIREALADIEGYRGASGTITFRGTEGDPKKPVVITRIRDGHVEYVKTMNP